MGGVPNLTAWAVSVYNDGKRYITQREGNTGRLDSGKGKGSGFWDGCKSVRVYISGGRRLAAFFLHQLPGNLTGGTRGAIFFSIYIFCVILFPWRFICLGGYHSWVTCLFNLFASLPYLSYLSCLSSWI